MAEIDLQKRYARVENGEIKEPYVLGLHIQNRGHDPILYHEVVFEAKPVANQFQNHREILVVSGRQVIASYVLEDKSIDQILNELHEAHKTAPAEGADPFTKPDLALGDVDQVVVARVLELVKKQASIRLDVFAEERDYDGIVSLATYATSNISKFQVEGQRGVDLRDQTFVALHGYMAEMMAGTVFVPKSWAEVEARLPVLTWEEVPEEPAP